MSVVVVYVIFVNVVMKNLMLRFFLAITGEELLPVPSPTHGLGGLSLTSAKVKERGQGRASTLLPISWESDRRATLTGGQLATLAFFVTCDLRDISAIASHHGLA